MPNNLLVPHSTAIGHILFLTNLFLNEPIPIEIGVQIEVIAVAEKFESVGFKMRKNVAPFH